MLLLYLAASILQVPNLEKQALLGDVNSEELRPAAGALLPPRGGRAGQHAERPPGDGRTLAWLN